TLNNVDQSIAYVRKELPVIKSPAVKEHLESINNSLKLLEETLEGWRRAYPDIDSPLAIDNGSAFANPGADRHTASLIAYTIALVSRVLEGTARAGSSVLLKMLKLYGYSLTMLNGGPNPLQTKALNDIPESIKTLEDSLNLKIPSIIHAVCPDCSCTYPPEYLPGASKATYPKFCTERSAALEKPCGAALLHQGKPLKTYHHYSFYDWFGRFIAHPDIEQYGNKFCEDIDQHPENPVDKQSFKDGTFVRSFKGSDGKLFIAERGNEGRWLFLLNADFFNVEGNRIRGKTRSTGVTSLSCLNLPLSMRNDPAWIFIPGLIEGPHEPNGKRAEHRYYWRLLIAELSAAYTRGLRPLHTYKTHESNLESNQRVFRAAIAGCIMDFKAARGFGGFLDVTSHHTCFVCKCWHTAHLGRTDYENWEVADHVFLKKGAEAWLNAEKEENRVLIERLHGTRYSELWCLPYWNPVEQLLVDPMHTVFLLEEQRFAREALYPGHQRGSRKKKTRQKLISFYHDFTPPPHPSDLQAPFGRATTNSTKSLFAESEPEDQTLTAMIWSDLSDADSNRRSEMMTQLRLQFTSDLRAFEGVLDIHEQLSSMPNTESTKEKTRKRLAKHNWPILAYRMSRPLVPLHSTDMNSEAALQRVRQAIKEISVPSWIAKPPSDFGDKTAGTLKADHWRVLFTIYIPLALISLWDASSPLAGNEARDRTSVLETSMFLTCASIAMTRNTLSQKRRNLFRHCLREHIEGLKKNFPGFLIPSHHLSFHIYDFMESFGTVRDWWGLPFEGTIGKLQRIPTNHKVGQVGATILYKWGEGAGVRRWLRRPDCPQLLKFCRDLLERAYSYDKRSDLFQEIVSDETDGNVENIINQIQAPIALISPLRLSQKGLPACLVKRLGLDRNPTCYSQIPAPKGFYSIPSAIAPSNSYVCYRIDHQAPWLAGQIQYMFDLKGQLHLAIARNRPFAGSVDPFAQYLEQEFEARTVSSLFHKHYDVVTIGSVIGHAARWEIVPGSVVVLCLSRVSDFEFHSLLLLLFSSILFNPGLIDISSRYMRDPPFGGAEYLPIVCSGTVDQVSKPVDWQ
ncbi:hypothetical protein EV360DRAFT_52975, partial [Lentinula raphanica]